MFHFMFISVLNKYEIGTYMKSQYSMIQFATTEIEKQSVEYLKGVHVFLCVLRFLKASQSGHQNTGKWWMNTFESFTSHGSCGIARNEHSRTESDFTSNYK